MTKYERKVKKRKVREYRRVKLWAKRKGLDLSLVFRAASLHLEMAKYLELVECA